MKSIKRKRRLIGRKSILDRIRFMYRLNVINEDEQKVVMGLRISHLIIWFVLLAIALLGAIAGISIFRKSPSQTGTLEQQQMTRMSIVEQALKLDSLEQELHLQDLYIQAIQEIISGNIKLDSVYSVDSLTKVQSQQLMDASSRENEFAERYEEEERFNISNQPVADNNLSQLSMFRPTAGLILEHFNNIERHYGVDIAASPNQNVVAIMDGTVMFADYTAGMGYTVCIVHPGQILSLYKHCESILKQAGDKVGQGESIALVGRGTDDLLKGSHLHFELWYQGQPLDPEKYILFQ